MGGIADDLNRCSRKYMIVNEYYPVIFGNNKHGRRKNSIFHFSKTQSEVISGRVETIMPIKIHKYFIWKFLPDVQAFRMTVLFCSDSFD